jgi:predicted transcriptional regulator
MSPQVAKFEPSRNEIDDFGGEEAFSEILHRAVATISKAIQQLLGALLIDEKSKSLWVP